MLQLTFAFGNDTYKATSKRVWAKAELFLANNFERKKVVFSQVTVYKNNNQFRVSYEISYHNHLKSNYTKFEIILFWSNLISNTGETLLKLLRPLWSIFNFYDSDFRRNATDYNDAAKILDHRKPHSHNKFKPPCCKHGTIGSIIYTSSLLSKP